MNTRMLRAALPLQVCLGAALLGGAAQAVNLRVLVATGPSVNIRVPITTAPAYPGADSPAPVSSADWNVGVRGGQLTLNGQDSGNASLYLAPTQDSVVGIGSVTYRGGVQLRAVSGRVEAVNVVSLEDYLRGVVPAEMPASWSNEALKAQAVIARSYAAARLSPGAPYDLCATEQCQVYGGVAKEQPSTDAAVAQTSGQVVSWKGAVAKTYFSADSGGFTASSREVWGDDVPYLVSQPDPASRSPKSAWTLEVPLTRAAEVAARYRVRVGALTSVTASRVSSSGRPLELVFVGAGGTARLTGADATGFVRSLGAYSTRVTLSGSNPLIIAGAGHGHGVGLSQWGAQGLAALNWNYLQILGFYYPGAAMSVLQESRAGLGASVAALGPSETLPRGESAVAALAEAFGDDRAAR